jgi:hypothetical protein
MKFAVYSGSEKLDIGDKRISCLCESEAQANHMAAFWAPYGYYEPLEAAETREVNLGVIEFHSEQVNPGLIKRFYAVRDDLTAAACIVDLWLMDIASVLLEFGYEMKVFRTPEKQAARIAARAERRS